MGLDMYLEGHYFVWDEERSKIKVEGLDLHGFELTNLQVQLGYWRKANHIHKWFVDNVQEGIDECQESYVDRDKLKELLGVCKEIMKDNTRAEELLPTQSGYFFGSTDYDECYFNEIKDTIEIIKKTLKLPKNWNIYYTSSW